MKGQEAKKCETLLCFPLSVFIYMMGQASLIWRSTSLWKNSMCPHLLDILQVPLPTVPEMSFYSSWCNSLSGLSLSHLCGVWLLAGVAPTWEVLILACPNVAMLYGIPNHSVVICNICKCQNEVVPFSFQYRSNGDHRIIASKVLHMVFDIKELELSGAEENRIQFYCDLVLSWALKGE